MESFKNPFILAYVIALFNLTIWRHLHITPMGSYNPNSTIALKKWIYLYNYKFLYLKTLITKELETS